jgi:multicomponent Na+:H+ antiporter subunit E
VVIVPAPQESELMRVIYANSITLTPGTLAMRVRGNGILVHALSEDGARTLGEGEMERRVTNLGRDP